VLVSSANFLEVSPLEKVKVGVVESTGPAEVGGVVVIVLGYIISRGIGDIGCAVKGVSG
jgi:hypothetical protein